LLLFTVDNCLDEGIDVVVLGFEVNADTFGDILND
jgi:hypothetical protein